MITHLLWIDTETSGLKPGYHEVMQLGAVLSDLAGEPIDEIEVCEPILWPERVEPGAVERHGISNIAEWNAAALDGPRLADFLPWVRRHAERLAAKMLFSGWNPGFDERMLRDNPTEDLDLLRHPVMDYHLLDVWSLAFARYRHEGDSLSKIATKLGLGVVAHRGKADAHVARRVWVELQRAVR